MALSQTRRLSRLSLLALCATICLTAGSASALILDITNTQASAGDGIGNGGMAVTNPYAASMTDTVSLSDGTLLNGSAVADVFAGHLGVFESSTGPSKVLSDIASFSITFSASGAQAGDFLVAQLKLSGNFTAGGGATAQLLDSDFGNLMTVTCNQYNVTNYGMGCISGYASGPPVLSNTITYYVPLDGRSSSFTLQGTLQVGSSTAPYSLDFLNSADLTLTVPSGTVVNGNLGGSLIQGAVPEPAAGQLLAAGLLGVGLVRRRPRRVPETA